MVAEFFENKEIFMTGGSGVVGKALIEKLLRSCNVGKIYLLLRPRKHFSIEERLEKLKMAMIFRRLRKQKPDELNRKLVAIPGDICLPFLGITSKYQKLMENVSIVFHSAATVRFDEPLREALRLNVGGTLEMLKFSETLKKLEVVMHVSTFFSNPYLKRVELQVYDSPMDWRFCLNLLERTDISEEQLDTITRKLIIGFPNTYCFTKNLAESLVNDHRHKLPVAIYRPSVILFAADEPEPGFAPSMTGLMGLFAVTGAGILKTVHMKQIPLDICTLDIAIKSLCYYTVKTANLYEKIPRLDKIPMYMNSSCTHSDFTFSQFIQMSQNHGFWIEAAFEKSLLTPYIYVTDSRLLYWILAIFLQLIPALLVDFALKLSGRKPLLMGLQRKLYTILEVTKPFVFNYYESPGITYADEMMEKGKGTEFNLDVIAKGNDYYQTVKIFQNVPYSVREHLLKEDPKTLPRSRKIMKVKIFLYKVIQFLLMVKLYEMFRNYIAHIY